MNLSYRKLYFFMKATRGNWRNALFIRGNCQSCSDEKESSCSGFLLTADADGRPVLMTVEAIRHLTGETIDAEECCGILTRQTFESVFSQYIEWNAVSMCHCPLRQLCQDAQRN